MLTPFGPAPGPPLTDVRRTVPKLDALRSAGDEEAYDRDVNQHHLVQVEHEPRPVPPDEGLEFVQVLSASMRPLSRSDVMWPSDAVSILKFTGISSAMHGGGSKRRAMAERFNGGPLASEMRPTHQQLPNGRRARRNLTCPN